MNLTTQKRLAASILKVGLNRVWMDPERMEEISMAITREGVMQLINDGAIKAKPQKGISSYRSKKIAEQKCVKMKLLMLPLTVNYIKWLKVELSEVNLT